MIKNNVVNIFGQAGSRPAPAKENGKDLHCGYDGFEQCDNECSEFDTCDNKVYFEDGKEVLSEESKERQGKQWEAEGAKFKEKREEGHIKLQALADFIGVAPSTISNFEKGGGTRLKKIIINGLDNYISIMNKQNLINVLYPMTKDYTAKQDDIALCCAECEGFEVCPTTLEYVGKNCYKEFMREYEGDNGEEVISILKKQKVFAPEV